MQQLLRRLRQERKNMISEQKIQASIDEVRAIARVDVCVFEPDGRTAASTLKPHELPDGELVESFARSGAESQTISDYHFFKVAVKGCTEYILAAKGSGQDVDVIGRLAASQLCSLISAYEDRYDRNAFIQKLLIDNLQPSYICNWARKLHIRQEAERMVFLIETKYDQDEAALETVRSLFGHAASDFITTVDEKTIVLVKEMSGTGEEPEHIARTLVDMINAEAMTQVRVSYGTMADRLEEVVKSYREAGIAMEVGRIFYAERVVTAYERLGIGRLIYHLPLKLCEQFVREVLGEGTTELLDEETLATVHRFFENGLNMSETARQLHVHRNTLVYRLEKLQKATGLDIRVFEDAMTFQIALMASAMEKWVKGQAK